MINDSYTLDSPKVSSLEASKVSQETSSIQKLLAEHREVANLMEQRLHAVLMPSGPTEGQSPQPALVCAPLTSDLIDFRSQLTALMRHYNDILNRLEI